MNAVCEACEGKHELPLIDVWAFKRVWPNKLDTMPHLGPLPCAFCRPDEAIDALKALLDKYGEPFPDDKVTGLTLWENKLGEPVLSVVTTCGEKA